MFEQLAQSTWWWSCHECFWINCLRLFDTTSKSIKKCRMFCFIHQIGNGYHSLKQEEEEEAETRMRLKAHWHRSGLNSLIIQTTFESVNIRSKNRIKCSLLLIWTKKMRVSLDFTWSEEFRKKKKTTEYCRFIRLIISLNQIYFESKLIFFGILYKCIMIERKPEADTDKQLPDELNSTSFEVGFRLFK